MAHNVYISDKPKPSAGKSGNPKSSHGSTKPSLGSRADLIKKKACIASKVLSKTCQNLRRDGVDEKCARLGITYLKWQGQKGPGMHISHVPTKKALFNYVLRGQRMNEDCILCPIEKHINSQYDILVHVRRVHVRHLITIRNMNLLMCRCSDICSQGTNNSVRNRHWHCKQCWQPFTTPAKLKTHILAKHKGVYEACELKHLDKSRVGPPPKL